MVLNNLLKPIFASFTKEKWKSKNPETRKKAIQELPVSDQETLNTIAMEDPDESIRATAANKLSDLDLLQTIIMKGTNECVKQAAQNRLFQLLCGIKHPIPDYDIREKMIRGSRNSALLEYVAIHADKSSLREITIKKISRDPLLGDVALKDSNAQIRQLAAQQIAKRSTLERVAKQSRRKDKRVYKIVKYKLDQIIEDEERPALLAKEVLDICDKLEKLHKRNRLLQEKTTFDNYVIRWQEIKNFANDGVTRRYNDICEKITSNITALEVEQQNEQHIIQKLESILNKLSNAIDELLNVKDNDIPEPKFVEINEKLVLKLGMEWDEDIKNLVNSEKQSLYNSRFQAILDLADCKTETYQSDNSFEKLKSLTEQAESMLQKTGFMLEKTIATLQNKFSLQIDNSNKQSIDVEQLQDRFHSAIEALQKKLKIQHASAQSFNQQIKDEIAQIKSVFADGHISQADKILHKLVRQIDKSGVISNSEKQNYHDILKQYQSELGNLSSWRNWAHDNERESLTQKAEKLLVQVQANTQLANEYSDVTTEIKNLRQQWKKMHSHTQESLWQRFNTACNQSYELCVPFIDAQTKIRQTNLKTKQAMCEQLEEYITSMGWPSNADSEIDNSVNWIQVDKITQQARKEWGSIGFVERKDHKAINKRFDKIIELIRNELKHVWKINQQEFYDLIHKVEQLHETLDEDLPAAINKAKDYQRQWKKIGPVSSYQRNKLWKKFRHACDVIFNKRQENIEHKNEQNKEKLREKEAICENLEALNQQPLNRRDLENAFKDIEKLWQELHPQAKAISNEVNTRFSAAKKDYQTKLNMTHLAEQQEQLALAKQKSDLCTQIEAVSEATNHSIETYKEQWQSISGLNNTIEASLQKRFQNALNSINENKETLKQEELERKHQFCLKYEILTGRDSPEAYQQARMKKQVELLNSNLGKVRKDEVSAKQLTPYELQLQWYQLSNYQNEEALEERFKNIIK